MGQKLSKKERETPMPLGFETKEYPQRLLEWKEHKRLKNLIGNILKRREK